MYVLSGRFLLYSRDTFSYSYHLSVEQCIDITRRIYMPIISEFKG